MGGMCSFNWGKKLGRPILSPPHSVITRLVLVIHGVELACRRRGNGVRRFFPNLKTICPTRSNCSMDCKNKSCNDWDEEMLLVLETNRQFLGVFW
jgi:hypothetical protein